MIPNIGPMEIAIVLIIALIVFGPKRLPELGNSLGRGIRDFSRSVKGEDQGSGALGLAGGDKADDGLAPAQHRARAAEEGGRATTP